MLTNKIIWYGIRSYMFTNNFHLFENNVVVSKWMIYRRHSTIMNLFIYTCRIFLIVNQKSCRFK